MKRIVLLALFAFCRIAVAQNVLENNPSSIRWNQIRTPNFRFLFPEGFETQAQRMANTFEHIREAESATMGGSPRPISVILQNQSAVSNGFVSMFPRRSEFFTMPSQNYNFAGTNDWLNLLAAHEYRHVVQYQNATRGFNKLLYYFFGSPAFAGMSHIAAPDWFWEGDAVATETAFTPGGRGKIPNFGLVFRTNLLEGRTFNYHKQWLRSYRHNIPNHYVLGYYMVSYAREKTNDPDIWEKVSARSWRVPFIPFAFSNAIRKEIGVPVTKLYKEAASDLRLKWLKQLDTLEMTSFEKVNPRRGNTYTDYLFPQPMPDGSVIVLKEGIGDISVFCRLKNGEEERIFTPGFINDTGMLSANQSGIFWSEFGFDPRWQVRNYSLVKAYNLRSGRRLVLGGKNARYAGAAVSPDSRFVVTTESTNQYRHNVVVLTYPRGKVERIFNNLENYFYSMPRWSDDGKRIVVLKTTPVGKTISILDFPSGREEDVLPLSNENTGHPVLHGQYLFFNTPVTGIDNIHVIDLRTKKRYSVTSSRYGAYNPAVSPDGKFIYYNEQGRNGFDVVRVPFNPTVWPEFDPAAVGDQELYSHLVEQEGNPALFDSIPKKRYEVFAYKKWRHLINPFSWGAYIDNDLANINIGINSQDILSTTELSFGYNYDINERTGFWKAGISYQGLYPIFDLNFTTGRRSVNEGEYSTVIVEDQDTTAVLVNDAVFKWKEQTISAGVRLPLNLTNGKYSAGLTISNYVGYTKVTDFDNGLNGDRFYPTLVVDGDVYGVYFYDYVANGSLLYNYANVSAYRLLKQSRRDVYSRWGQTINLKYYSTPFGGDYSGGVASALSYLFFPGVARNHSLFFYGAYQRYMNSPYEVDREHDYYFRNTVPVPRGYSLPMFRDYYGASVNYMLPLWYPDIALGPVLNLQRFRATLFADYGQGNTSFSFSKASRTYTSVGGELKVDFNFMRLLMKFDIGVRYSYGIDPEVRKFELVIGTINF